MVPPKNGLQILPLPPLLSLVFMLLYGAAQRTFKNHLSWYRRIYLGPSIIKERSLHYEIGQQFSVGNTRSGLGSHYFPHPLSTQADI